MRGDGPLSLLHLLLQLPRNFTGARRWRGEVCRVFAPARLLHMFQELHLATGDRHLHTHISRLSMPANMHRANLAHTCAFLPAPHYIQEDAAFQRQMSDAVESAAALAEGAEGQAWAQRGAAAREALDLTRGSAHGSGE